jgi:hypothetical protein
MAIYHIAWLRFAPEVTDERIDEHLQACRALPDQVPVVQQLVCGPNHNLGRSDGFTHGIIVTLPSIEAVPAYLDHPAHVPVAERLVADLADIRVMDLEA